MRDVESHRKDCKLLLQMKEKEIGKSACRLSVLSILGALAK
jgi:hypothetical protein